MPKASKQTILDEEIKSNKNKEYMKEYYAKNREKLLADWKFKIECKTCKKMVTKNNMKRHIKCPLHQTNLLKQENEDIHNNIDEIVKKAVKKALKEALKN
jgi:hypothetical protein